MESTSTASGTKSLSMAQIQNVQTLSFLALSESPKVCFRCALGNVDLYQHQVNAFFPNVGNPYEIIKNYDIEK
jgi:hypothetical protein